MMACTSNQRPLFEDKHCFASRMRIVVERQQQTQDIKIIIKLVVGLCQALLFIDLKVFVILVYIGMIC